MLVQRGLIASREQAQEAIEAGWVSVDGRVATRSSQRVPAAAVIEITERRQYVGRGGLKLEAALQHWPVEVEGAVCADVGSSTGGFTDCLLQRGAGRVYAIDVGTAQMHPSLRDHPRVALLEQTNARYLTSLPEPIDLAVVDVSFISARLILPTVARWLGTHATTILLLKPQFEAPSETKRGVIRGEAVRRRIIRDFTRWAHTEGWSVSEPIAAPLLGDASNHEYLIRLLPAHPPRG